QPGGKQMLLVGGPGRTSDERRSRGAKRLDRLGRTFLRACPDLVVASVAGDADSVGANALLPQSLGVLLVDCADALDRAVSIAEQRTGENSAPPRGLGERRADHTDWNSDRGGALRERGPDIEPAKDQATGVGGGHDRR